jgi:5-methylcytosine-specific restriction protein A
MEEPEEFGFGFPIILLDMSRERVMPGGWVDRQSMATSSSGRPLCRWCNLEVPRGRFTFCSAWCVEEWKLRSDPGHLRQRVFERDHGICAQCGLDCVAHFRHLKKLRGAARSRAESEWNWGSRKSLWDADHIVPVAEGGGECDVSNMRTLCLKCHRNFTSALRARLGNKKALSPLSYPG